MKKGDESHIFLYALLIVVVLIGIGFLIKNVYVSPGQIPARVPVAVPAVQLPSSDPPFKIVAENLIIPWDIEFLPNDDMVVTERPGNLLRIGTDTKKIPIEGVDIKGEGGLLGLALHPKFEQNHFMYVYLTATNENRVERYTFDLDKNTVHNRKVILGGIPTSSFHDGGRIKFGPDGYLYITTGDTTNAAYAQDTKSLAGKILRVTDEGEIPTDNPFGTEVYSYGHRNPQGIAWDSDGNLWETEHGPSGPIETGQDELNIIQKGKNYGWDIIFGDKSKTGMESPLLQSGSAETWAPAGTAYYKGNIFFTGLRGETLYQYAIKEKTLQKHYIHTFGRLRPVTVHKGFLYFASSNQDGRGNHYQNEDKIIRVKLDALV